MKNFKKAYEFDFVQDTQQVFREMLHVIANPGTIRSIKRQGEMFNLAEGSLVALGCTVLDNETSFYVEKNPKLHERLQELTLAQGNCLQDADYLFFSTQLNYTSIEELMKHGKHGTYEDPQNSATYFIQCENLEGDQKVCLKGPGVNGEKTVNLSLYVKQVIEIRQRIKLEYPLGIDLYFISKDGDLMGVPRLCSMKEAK